MFTTSSPPVQTSISRFDKEDWGKSSHDFTLAQVTESRVGQLLLSIGTGTFGGSEKCIALRRSTANDASNVTAQMSSATDGRQHTRNPVSNANGSFTGSAAGAPRPKVTPRSAQPKGRTRQQRRGSDNTITPHIDSAALIKLCREWIPRAPPRRCIARQSRHNETAAPRIAASGRRSSGAPSRNSGLGCSTPKGPLRRRMTGLFLIASF